MIIVNKNNIIEISHRNDNISNNKSIKWKQRHVVHKYAIWINTTTTEGINETHILLKIHMADFKWIKINNPELDGLDLMINEKRIKMCYNLIRWWISTLLVDYVK